MPLPPLDSRAIALHVQAALAAAPLRNDPMPHLVVERILPDSLYAALLDAIPPARCFSGAHVKPNWRFTPDGVSPDAYRLWRFMADDVIGGMLAPAITERFGIVSPPGSLRCSDIRLLLRRPGYRIRPHLDPGKSVVTTLLYLARPGEPEDYGTQLFRSDRPVPAPGDRTLYPEDARCELAATIPFRANTALIFANQGLHGAHIPPDAPADLERYAIQFYIGSAATPATESEGLY